VYDCGGDVYLEPFFYKDEKREGWRENYIYKLPSGEIVAIFDDVTDNMNFREKLLKQNEELKIARDKAEESNHLKTAFLNNISHEFRTPLNGILGFTSLITKPDLQSRQRQVYSEQITQSSERLLDIVTDIVEIARVQSNSAVLNLSPVNIRHLIYESIKDVQSKIGSKNIDFRVFIPDDLDISLETDEFKIIRSIKHLLENAIKFTSEGTVELTTGLVNGNHLFIKVMDTGIGIAEDLQDVVFEPFRQVETLMTRNYGGNGVGLPLVKAYMNMLGGTADLKSTKGRGTTVNLNIPLSANLGEKQQESASLTDKLPDKNKMVLVVDDEPANCMYLKEVLSELDAEILCTGNGKEAVDYCKEKPVIDIVLMDIKMPIMDGFEATKRIKDENPEITVIAQTAFTSDRDVQRIKNHGFDDYLSKPIRREELLNVLKMYIGV
jgi:two-component system sensor histidine kinase EvgS